MKQRYSYQWIGLGIISILLGSCGCTEQQARPGMRTSNLPAAQTNSVALRFQEGTDHSQTVVQSAVELSEKYSALSEEMVALRQENHALATENAELKLRIEVLEQDLSQCEGELNETNALLLDMLGELNEWKSDVLDYRNEMRDSAKAQMNALLKILSMMGAEVSDSQEVSQ